MENEIEKIIEQQKIIANILGNYDPPKMRKGINENTLLLLETKMRDLSFYIPESYRIFLEICDGIENASCSFDLLGSKEFLDESYSSKLLEILDLGVGFEFDVSTSPLLIGMSSETNTKVFFEYSHQRKLETEPIVLEGEPGLYTLHYSFYDFLKCRIEANEKTINALQEYMKAN